MLPVVVAKQVSEFRPQLGRQEPDRFTNQGLVAWNGQPFGDVQGSQNDRDLISCQHDLVRESYEWAILGHLRTYGRLQTF